MADAGGLQLLPNTRKRIDYSAPGQNRLLLLSFVFVVLVVGAYFALSYYKEKITSELNVINEDIVKNEEARSKTDEDNFLKLKNSLSAVEPLLKKHNFWSSAVTHLQSKIHPEVQFSSLSMNSNKDEIVFKAQASSYTTVARQIAAFYSDSSITEVVIGKIIAMPDGRAEFSIQLKFDPAKLIRK